MSKTKDYLGDAVYVDFDGYGLTLTTEDGINVLDRIYLEPDVFTALVRYQKDMVDAVSMKPVEPETGGAAR